MANGRVDNNFQSYKIPKAFFLQNSDTYPVVLRDRNRFEFSNTTKDGATIFHYNDIKEVFPDDIFNYDNYDNGSTVNYKKFLEDLLDFEFDWYPENEGNDITSFDYWNDNSKQETIQRNDMSNRQPGNAFRVSNEILLRKDADPNNTKRLHGHEALKNHIFYRERTEIFVPKHLLKEYKAQPYADRMVQYGDVSNFYHDGLLKLQRDPKYRRPFDKYGVRFQDVELEVWIYSKALDKIINATKFVIDLNMDCQKQVSSFNFTLAHINRLEDFTINTEVFLSHFDSKDNVNFWERNLQINDIVWIKLEQLEIEGERNKDFVIDKKDLPNQIFDMIGLIDTVQESRNKTKLDSIVKVQGRDLAKVFIDDQAYFHPVAISSTGNRELILSSKQNNDDENLLNKRNFITGQYHILFGKVFQQIGKIFDFWLSMLANMGVVPASQDGESGLFSAYGDKRVRRASYDIEGRVIDPKGKLQKGVYQIIQLMAANETKDRLVIDSSVGNPQGPFLNLFNKICQYPFVEVIMDTVIDQYLILVREPPYHPKTLENYIDTHAITVDNISVVSTDLAFSQDIYTWFQLDPKGNYFGKNDQIAMSYCPIVQLDEYVRIWGSRRCYVVTNYMSAKNLEGNVKKEAYDNFKKFAVKELMHLINVYSVLPFTRTGKITLNHTDRRIKKGSYIYLETTREIFYVDAVQHYVSKSTMMSQTVISVSRGMVKEHIPRSEGKLKKSFSYFEIVNSGILENALMKLWANETIEVSHQYSDIVNPDAFEFFLKRGQFSMNQGNIKKYSLL